MQIRKLFSILSNSLFLLIVGLSPASGQNNGNTAIGSFKTMKAEEQTIAIETENAYVFVKVYSSNMMRVSISKSKPNHDFSYAVVGAPLPTKINLNQQENEIILSTDSLKLIIDKKTMQFSFYDSKGKLINADETIGTQFTGNEITAFKKLFDSERFIGLGEKTGNLDRRGNGYVNWNTDCYGYGPETDPMYISIPFYIGIHDSICYGIFLDNTSRSNFNFGASNTRFSSFSVEDGNLNYYFIYHSTISGIIESYTSLTGRTPMPSEWSLGFQQCRWSYFPDTEVMNIAKTFREKDIPLDVIYLDIHYMDNYKIFTWNNERFP
ncbi:MAG: TIM-barrel domain-containing protein, partial [Chitinophagales bacterium]